MTGPGAGTQKTGARGQEAGGGRHGEGTRERPQGREDGEAEEEGEGREGEARKRGKAEGEGDARQKGGAGGDEKGNRGRKPKRRGGQERPRKGVSSSRKHRAEEKMPDKSRPRPGADKGRRAQRGEGMRIQGRNRLAHNPRKQSTNKRGSRTGETRRGGGSRSWYVTLALRSKTWAKGWENGCPGVRSRLEPIKEVAKTIKQHLWGILNAVVLKVRRWRGVRDQDDQVREGLKKGGIDDLFLGGFRVFIFSG